LNACSGISTTQSQQLASSTALPTSLLLVQPSPAVTIPAQPTSTPATVVDWKSVEQAMGKSGAMQPGNVFRISLPRTDLQVTLRGVPLKAGFALGSNVQFMAVGSDGMAMGDLVLTEEEVSPVMLKLQQGGIEITAVHNHLIGESPRVMYLHFQGHGDPVKIAESIQAALALSKTPFSAAPSSTPNETVDLDMQQLDQIIGRAGKANGGIYQFSVPRAEKITSGGMEIPPAMGVATAINFQPLGGGKAAITGDFALLATEVDAVARALRDNGIEVTALHSHTMSEDPRLFYMHFWSNDDALKLARGLRAALDQTNSAKATN
jgi:Domain of Unknown Function (DUF1259)